MYIPIDIYTLRELVDLLLYKDIYKAPMSLVPHKFRIDDDEAYIRAAIVATLLTKYKISFQKLMEDTDAYSENIPFG